MALDKLKPASYSQITYEHGRVFYRKTLGGENVGKLYYELTARCSCSEDR